MELENEVIEDLLFILPLLFLMSHELISHMSDYFSRSDLPRSGGPETFKFPHVLTASSLSLW